MTVPAADVPRDPSIPVLPPGASPRAIHAALVEEERVEFDRDYQVAMADASRTLDLTGVLDVLRNWQRIAWMTQQQGVEAHRAMLDKARRIEAGERYESVPVEDIRALIRGRLAR